MSLVMQQTLNTKVKWSSEPFSKGEPQSLLTNESERRRLGLLPEICGMVWEIMLVMLQEPLPI